MKQEDIEYILWLAKRLVYRYKEDEDIITKIETILKTWKESYLKDKYQKEYIDKHINIIIENIAHIAKYNISFDKQETIGNVKQLQSEKTNNQTQTSFEDLDLNDIFN